MQVGIILIKQFKTGVCRGLTVSEIRETMFWVQLLLLYAGVSTIRTGAMSWALLLLLMHAGESTTGMGATSWSLLLLLLHTGVSTIGMGTKYWVLLSLLLHIGVSTIRTNADG